MQKRSLVEILCLSIINARKAFKANENTKDYLTRLETLETLARQLLSERATLQLRKEEDPGQ